ncbi:MAG: RDD family protein [Nitriliruptorales bacterium]|nr:RDD family protein [Nitriliruptorales bacterium]
MSDHEPRHDDQTPEGSQGSSASMDSDPTQSTPSGSPPPPPPAGQPTHGTEESWKRDGGKVYGGAWIRLGARIVDGFIVGIPLSIIFLIIPGVDTFGVAYSVISALVGFGYFVFLETSQGATYGKKLLNLRVADHNDRSPIEMDSSFRRNWWMLLGVLSGIPVIGFLASLASLGIAIAIGVTISSDNYNQGWHDKMANTTVPRTS